MHAGIREPERGREHAFADLIAAHQKAVWRYLRFLGCDHGQAEDLLQETFLAVWRRPFEERDHGSSRKYLRVVARNLFLMARRARRVRLGFGDIDEADDGWERYAADAGDSYREALKRCLEGLAPKARQAIELQYYSGCSRSEIGAQLGATPDGVKTLMRRTRAFLHECIRRGLDGGER